MALSSSRKIDRRHLLVSTGGAALAAMAAPRASLAASSAFVTSETGRLRKVLVHTATAADHSGSGLDPFAREIADDIVAQHAELVTQVQGSGAEVVHLEDVLEAAIAEAKRRGAWQPWLRTTFPELAGMDDVRAATLLARDPAAPKRHVMEGLAYLRDFAVMLPAGLMLANLADPARARQSDVFRFMVSYAPALRGYPVIFDARTQGLRAEGGDIQVLDANTILVGVGNHTDAEVAPRLAQAAGMDVVAVNIANADLAKWRLDHDPLRDFFFHLNTSVAQIAPGHVLALSWVFENEHTGRSMLKNHDKVVAEFGTVSRYQAHTGTKDATVAGMKLADYLCTRGIAVGRIGGDAPDDLARLLDDAADRGVIFPARERQAANVLATSPGNLLAFRGADTTHATLRAGGANVRTVGTHEMWRGYGGPHCLTLPLERA